jgi:hypothetical protein
MTIGIGGSGRQNAWSAEGIAVPVQQPPKESELEFRTRQDPASPEVQARIRDSFDRRGMMAHTSAHG